MLFRFSVVIIFIYRYMLFQQRTGNFTVLNKPELFLRISSPACRFRLGAQFFFITFNAQYQGIRRIFWHWWRLVSPFDNYDFHIIVSSNNKRN